MTDLDFWRTTARWLEVVLAVGVSTVLGIVVWGVYAAVSDYLEGGENE